jgi:hypothetical protein
LDGLSTSVGNDFIILLGNEKNEWIKNAIPSLTFHHESDGKEYISFEDNIVELGRYEDFVHSLHTMQIVLDHSNKTVSVLLDGKQVLANIPLASIYRFSPAVSFAVGEGLELAIDDLNVKMGSAQEQEWYVLFNEDFERFIDDEQLKESGWVTLTALNQTAESVAMKIKILATDKLPQHGQLSFPLFFDSSFIIQHSAFKSLSFYLGALVAILKSNYFIIISKSIIAYKRSCHDRICEINNYAVLF